jgi:hypothetical protein
MLLPLLLVMSLLSSSTPALNTDEQAIFAATVTFAHLDPFDSTAMLPDDHVALLRLAEEPHPIDFRTYDGARHAIISDELVNALRAANRKSVSLRKVAAITQTKGRYHDSVSRPGISRDGLSALIVHFNFAGGGAFQYLEKHDGRWQVVAGGLGWDV